MVGNGTRIRFLEDLWWGVQSMCSQFSRLFRVTTVRNLSISAILDNDTSLSGDFIFCRNLTNVEIEDLERVMPLLSHVHLSPFVPNAKA